MHGVKRQRAPLQRDPEDVARAKAAKERARIDEYLDLRARLAEKKAVRAYTSETLNLTTQVLLINPEYPSGWAQRRRTIVRGLFPSIDDEARQRLLEQDLELTAQCLKRNPKEYAVWEHRKWVLKTMPDPDWRYELKTVEAMLERDARNFHAWDYRRYLVTSILAAPPQPTYSTRKRPSPTTSSELAFTTSKIAANFSNFSAWHYRSKMLLKLWDEQGHAFSSEERRKRIDEEFELVKQAFYTDPDDQSAWIYHRWLASQYSAEDESKGEVLRREIQVIEELLEIEPESKWCLESLVYYGGLLLASSITPSGDADLRQKCLDRLKLLQEVDPLRRNRYRDLETQFHA